MKKRILSVSMAFVMIFAFAAFMTGCGDTDPVEAYNKAAANMNAAADVQMQGKMTAKIEAQGQSQEMGIDFDATVIKSTTDDPADMQAHIDMDYNMMGQSVQIEMYIKDKKSYVKTSEGTKTKTEFTKEAADAVSQLTGTEQKIDDFVKESKTDGDDVILTLDSKKYLTDLLGKVGNLSGASKGSMDADSISEMLKVIDLKDITLTATIKDENFTAMKVAVPAEIDMSTFTSMITGGTAGSSQQAGEKMKMDINFNMDPIKVGSGAKIDFPAFSDYK